MRRRKNRGTWFPVLGTREQAGDDTHWDTSWFGALPTPTTSGAPSSLNVRALTFDSTQEPDDVISQNFSLRDLVEGQDWTCQRIVGKFHAQTLEGTSDPEGDWANARVALGIFVARSKDDAQSEPDLDPVEFDPWVQSNAADSWMFRRTWVLGNTRINPVDQGGPTFPGTTANYGSVLDGPHIDVKSKRRIQREERLWGVISVRGWTPGFADPIAPTLEVHWTFDYRIHGAMRRASNKRAIL